MVLDLVNKVVQEPIAGQKEQVGLPGPRRKWGHRERKKPFSARLWNEKDTAMM